MNTSVPEAKTTSKVKIFAVVVALVIALPIMLAFGTAENWGHVLGPVFCVFLMGLASGLVALGRRFGGAQGPYYVFAVIVLAIPLAFYICTYVIE